MRNLRSNRLLSRYAMLAGMLALLSCPAASAETVHDGGEWFALFARGEMNPQLLSGRLRWWFDGHLRLFEDAGGFGQSIVRPGVGYALSDRAALWAGYGWIHTDPGSRDGFDENRVWQQLTLNETVGASRLGSRTRLEQRFLDTGSETGWRLRQLVSCRRPIERTDRLGLVLWDEVFIHLNDTNFGAEAGFDQNRIFAGLSMQLEGCCPGLRVEAGYLNQAIHTAGAPDRVNHLFSLNFFWLP